MITALLQRLQPAWRSRISRASLRADAQAGVLGTVLALPQGFAFATLAGLPPQYGLSAAMVAALAGASWHVVPLKTVSVSEQCVRTAEMKPHPGVSTAAPVPTAGNSSSKHLSEAIGHRAT